MVSEPRVRKPKEFSWKLGPGLEYSSKTGHFQNWPPPSKYVKNHDNNDHNNDNDDNKNDKHDNFEDNNT